MGKKKALTFEEKMALRTEEHDKEIAEIRAMVKENSEAMKTLRKELNGMGLSNSLAAEHIISDALKKRLSFGGVDFDYVVDRVSAIRKLPGGERIQGEYDSVLYNGTAVAIIEAKYRVRQEDVDYLINVQLPRFKTLFPQYESFKIYLGIGGLSFDDGAEEKARQSGLGTIKLDGEAVTAINDSDVKAW